jgi:hypothetical protein
MSDAKQNQETEDCDKRIEYLYKEYSRLSDKCDELIKSIFDDLKLFGAIGATIVLWKPISDFIPINAKSDSNYILFLSFLSLSSVVE